MIEASELWAAVIDACTLYSFKGIKAFSETDFTEDRKAIDVLHW